MSKKTSKHRAIKAVKPPTPRCKPPAFTSSTTKVVFHSDKGRHYWKALRGGACVAEGALGFSKKDKMKRSFLNLVDSFRAGNWVMSSQP